MFHILNGDALLQQFPSTIPGRKLVVRECLVDGPVTGISLEGLFSTRLKYMAQTYRVEEVSYAEKTIREFNRMRTIPEGATVYLWFEDDLFCQVNAWFVASIFDAMPHDLKICWVTPSSDLELGFGGMDSKELYSAYKHASPIKRDDLSTLATMWPAYQHQDFSSLIQLAVALQPILPMLPAAVAAHIERFPADGSPGRPQRVLQALQQEYGKDNFGKAFQEFSRTQAIYGFGDLQVKRIWDSLS
jgi:hypothetical protein